VEFAKVLGEVTRFLEERGYQYGLAGAFALHAYGLMRATADLDFVVEDRAQEDLLRFLDGLGYERLHVSNGYSHHVHPLASLGRLDFIYVDTRTAELMFGAARHVAVLPGKQVPVPKPEHLAAMKVLAMKNDSTRALQERADIQFLLGLPGVDEDEIRRYFERYGLRERFDEIKRNMPARS
jgi:hypothetical protein